MRSWLVAVVMVVGIAASDARAAPSWSPQDLALLQTLRLDALAPPPPDPSNRVADDPRAVALGRSLFSDRRLSANGRVSCAGCHIQDHGFTDGLAVGHGVKSGSRRTMPIAAAVYSPWQFWDGRADSLWAQALGPVENPVEHGFTRTQVVKVLATYYRGAYEQTFGPLPALGDLEHRPPRASPAGDARAQAAWAGMQTDGQAKTNAIFANFGKAIAAYERTLKVRPGRFDRYLAGLSGKNSKPAALTGEEAAGLRLFIGKGQCVSCHTGPLLSDGAFHNTGVPRRPGRSPDPGRSDGIGKAISDPFNCLGPYSDAQRERCEELSFAVVDSPAQVGAFKVPSLRGVGQRAPYMHAGQFASLDRVVKHYSRAPRAAIGLSELRPLHLSLAEQRQIVAFLRTLNEAPAAKPLPKQSHDR